MTLPTTVLPAGSVANGRYRLLGSSSAAGDEVIYDAATLATGRAVRLHELHPAGARLIGEQLTPPTTLDSGTWTRAKREYLQAARQIATLTHPALTRVTDLFEERGTAYFVTEDHAPRTLAQVIATKGALAPKDVTRLAPTLFGALSAAHEQGVWHLDLSPERVRLREDGTAVLADFGFARTLTAALTHDARAYDEQHAPPEQRAAQGRVGAYSDVYALSATLFHALHGEAPPNAASRELGSPLPASPPGTPSGLSAALARGLEVSLHDRALSTRELLDVLRVPPVSPPAPPALVAAVTPDVQDAPNAPTSAPTAPPAARHTAPSARAAASPQWAFAAPLALALLGALALGTYVLTRTALRGAPASVVSADSPDLTPRTATNEAAKANEAAAPAPATEAPELAARSTVGSFMVTAEALHLRAEPSTSAAERGTLPLGTIVNAFEERGKWLLVQHDGTRAWINAEFVVPLRSAEESRDLVRAISDGGDVSVPRGVYPLSAPLVIESDTALIGDGADRTFLVGSGIGETFVTRGVNVSLSGLSVLHVGPVGRVVRAQGGTLRLDRVTLRGAAHEDETDDFGRGLWLQGDAAATITDSDLRGNAFGLYVTEGSVATVTTSRLSGNREGGALFRDDAGGRIESSVIEDNGAHGVHVAGTAAPTLERNRIRRNAGRGVTVYDAARPTLSGNTIEENALQGVGVQDTAAPALKDNTIQGNRQSGVTFFDNAGGVLEGNTIQANVKAGVSVTEYAAPTLERNTIRRNKEGGVAYADHSGGVASGNDIASNGMPGVAVWGDARVSLSGNAVRDNLQSGVVIAERATGEADGNNIQGNALDGFIVTGNATMTVTGNIIMNNRRGGLRFKQGAKGTTSGNTCTGNNGADLVLELDPDNAGPDLYDDQCSLY